MDSSSAAEGPEVVAADGESGGTVRHQVVTEDSD
jgi:hypothetical protein